MGEGTRGPGSKNACSGSCNCYESFASDLGTGIHKIEAGRLVRGLVGRNLRVLRVLRVGDSHRQRRLFWVHGGTLGDPGTRLQLKPRHRVFSSGRQKREEKNRASWLWEKPFVTDVGSDISSANIKDDTGTCGAGHEDRYTSDKWDKGGNELQIRFQCKLHPTPRKKRGIFNKFATKRIHLKLTSLSYFSTTKVSLRI